MERRVARLQDVVEVCPPNTPQDTWCCAKYVLTFRTTAATMFSLSTRGHSERSCWSAFDHQQFLCDDVGEHPESCTKSPEGCSLDFTKYADSIILFNRSSCAPQRCSRLASAPSSSERCYLQRRSSNETTSVQHRDLFLRNPRVLLFEEDGPGYATFY